MILLVILLMIIMILLTILLMIFLIIDASINETSASIQVEQAKMLHVVNGW